MSKSMCIEITEGHKGLLCIESSTYADIQFYLMLVLKSWKELGNAYLFKSFIHVTTELHSIYRFFIVICTELSKTRQWNLCKFCLFSVCGWTPWKVFLYRKTVLFKWYSSKYPNNKHKLQIINTKYLYCVLYALFLENKSAPKKLFSCQQYWIIKNKQSLFGGKWNPFRGFKISCYRNY